jgi:hypothetical protein
MAAIAKMLSRVVGVEMDVDTLKPILLFCGTGSSIIASNDALRMRIRRLELGDPTVRKSKS